MTTVPLLLFSLSFAYVSHHICLLPLQLHLITPSFPISLNSLDREGARFLSPSNSKFTSKLDAGTDDSVPDDALELKWEFYKDSRRYYVSFPDDQ